MVSLPDIQQEVIQQATFNTVLVVEDDEDTREMLTMCIESETSYRVMSLASAEETLERLPKIREAKPRLFILDFQLSTLTGLELYDSLHALKEFEYIPAVIITAATLNLHLVRAIAQRKIPLLLKPFDVDELIGCIERILIGPGQLI
jgi:DNA-binding NtrC family response regulator